MLTEAIGGGWSAATLNQDRARWLADPTLRRRLRRLEVPTLVLHGRRHRACPVAPSMRLEVLPEVGHTPWLEDAATVRQALRRLIKAM